MMTNSGIYLISASVIISTSIYIKCRLGFHQLAEGGGECCSRVKSATIGVVAISLAMLALLSLQLLNNKEDGPPMFFLAFTLGSILGLGAYTWNQRNFAQEFLSEQLQRITNRSGDVAPAVPSNNTIQISTLNSIASAQKNLSDDGGIYVG